MNESKNLSESMLTSLIAIPVHVNDKDTVLPIQSLFIYDPNQDFYIHTFGKEIPELEGMQVRLSPYPSAGSTQEEYNLWLYKNFREVACPPELQIKKTIINPSVIIDTFKSKEWPENKIGATPILTFREAVLPSKLHLGSMIKFMTPFVSKMNENTNYQIGESYPTLGFYRDRQADAKMLGYDNPDYAKKVYAPFKVLIVNKAKQVDLIPYSYVQSTGRFDLLFILNYYIKILLNKLRVK